MNQRLPPLNALRAFEAAARHLSFSRAAAELHVTPAAISHQIKSLEEFLDIELFRRLPKNLLLTDAGQAALPALREGFEHLTEAVNIMCSNTSSRTLTVSVAPSFGGKWLVPRLENFYQTEPGIDVRIDAVSTLVDFKQDDVDVAIRYGAGNYPGLHEDCLLADEIIPVCSPVLLQGEYPLCKPQDLCRHTLLHIDDPIVTPGWPDWTMWLLSAGVSGIDPKRGPRFTHSGMAIQVALEGHGVALVSSVLVSDDLAAGRLVKPFELSFPVNFCYFFVCPETKVQEAKVAAFRNWLLQEAKQFSVHTATKSGQNNPPQ